MDERPSQAACSRQAGALRSEPGLLQPSAQLASPSGSPLLLRPLAVLGWGETLSARRPRLPQHGGRSALLRLGFGQQRPPPPARPRAGAPVCALRLVELERGSEGEPRVGAAGTVRTPRGRGQAAGAPEGAGLLACSSDKGDAQDPSLCPPLARSPSETQGSGGGRGTPFRRISPEASACLHGLCQMDLIQVPWNPLLSHWRRRDLRME